MRIPVKDFRKGDTILRLLCVTILFSVVSVSGLAQQIGVEGAILGIAQDSSGAVLPGAAVRVTNLDTRRVRLISTDAAGNFEVPALPLGRYSLEITHSGFKTWVLKETELTLRERKRVSAVLELGAVAEQISVEAASEIIQTDKSGVEKNIESKQLRELPIAGRNPVELVNLVPGVRYLGKNLDIYNYGVTVQGLGAKQDGTQFQVDGNEATGSINDYGIAIPNVDTVAQLNVETSSYAAEFGRYPLQIQIATKSGTNELHGTLWEYHKNTALNARNAFAVSRPKLIRNQFGGVAGGPVIRNKTFFFGSFEEAIERREIVWNDPNVIQPAWLAGDFSTLGRAIRDPLTGQPFPGNRILEGRMSNASRYFFPWHLAANSPDGAYRSVAPIKHNSREFLGKLDHNFNERHRLYGRYIVVDYHEQPPFERPDIIQQWDTRQQSVGTNYHYSITPRMLLSLNLSYLRVSPIQEVPGFTGKENHSELAGVQGIGTRGREEFIGLPTINFSGYARTSVPIGPPYRQTTDGKTGAVAMNVIRSQHSLSYGYVFSDKQTISSHGSCCVRGSFTFNGQYTGNSFADYLLGYLQSSIRNYPIARYGMSNSPYSALYLQDFWKITPSVTLNLGMRYDYWHEKSFVRGNGATFSLKHGKIIAGEDENGRVDLGAQPIAPFLAKATQGLWVPASQVGFPPGLFFGNGYLSPRLGVTWRPLKNSDLVVRAGYGIFTSSFNSNITSSQIVGAPYWTRETIAFSSSTLQRWETAWPVDPETFTATSVGAAVADVKSAKAHEWNVGIQTRMPLRSAFTISYLGSRMVDNLINTSHNDVPPGQYPNLQAARPYPELGSISLRENAGTVWYEALQLKWERRFANGLSGDLAYSFSKNLEENLTPFAPKGYDRGRAPFDRTHMLALNSIYELPFGRGKRWLSGPHPFVNGLLGGWQLSGIYMLTSGSPLIFNVPGATLGNGLSTRANLVGNPKLPNPAVGLWFNPNAFAPPPLYAWGNSGIGILDGPGSHALNLGLMKSFYFRESKYLQFRCEMFNAPNHVNFGNPNTNIGFATTGRISSAGDARSIQFALKAVF